MEIAVIFVNGYLFTDNNGRNGGAISVSAGSVSIEGGTFNGNFIVEPALEEDAKEIDFLKKNRKRNRRIVLASVEVLQGAPLGGMVATFKGDQDSIHAALSWLEEHHVEVEVLRRG